MAPGFIDPTGGRWDLGGSLPHQTTRLQMVPSSSISHCTSSPRCEGGQGDMVASVPGGVHCVPLAPSPT